MNNPSYPIETSHPVKLFERVNRTNAEGLELPMKVSLFKVEQYEDRGVYTFSSMGSHFQAVVNSSGQVEFLELNGVFKENEDLVREATNKLVKRHFSSRVG